MRRIVMPGGSGYLGEQLTARLVARGDEVVVLSRGRPTSTPGVRTIHWRSSVRAATP